MSESHQLHHLSAFTERVDGGNPAGVWIGGALPSNDAMQQIAADLGYSETAFLAPRTGAEREVRYFSPVAEVPFCGHATIAAGVALGRTAGEGTYNFNTRAGSVPVQAKQVDGRMVASLTSVATSQKEPDSQLLERALAALHWQRGELDLAIPPMLAYAGAWHLVLAVGSKARLNSLDYEFEPLKQLMLEYDLTTLQLVWREHEGLFHSRNPFPIGDVVEDAATGAAAAALGGYLRDAGLISTPTSFEILQGAAMGRPSHITVTVPEVGGIEVIGTAVALFEGATCDD